MSGDKGSAVTTTLSSLDVLARGMTNSSFIQAQCSRRNELNFFRACTKIFFCCYPASEKTRPRPGPVTARVHRTVPKQCYFPGRPGYLVTDEQA